MAGEKRARSGEGEGRQESAPKRVKMRDLESVLRLKGFFFFFFFFFCFVFFNFLGFCSSESLIFVKIIIYEFASFSTSPLE